MSPTPSNFGRLSCVPAAAGTQDNLPKLEGVGDITNRVGGYPYGAHVCEVEVDPHTGHVDILTWTAVDDVGLAVNPLILHGQAHGAIAQGIGQALLEAIQYDPESAQLLTGSFMDYAMPRADNTPPFKTLISEVPASSHPHGIRPGGEGGTTPAGVVPPSPPGRMPWGCELAGTSEISVLNGGVLSARGIA